MEPTIIQQQKSPVLSEKREVLADRLISLAARIESLIFGKYAYVNEFYGYPNGDSGFLEVFKDLVPRTSHESCIKEAKYGNVPLTVAIENYFTDPEKKIETGIKLAREYYKILITSGVIHDHE